MSRKRGLAAGAASLVLGMIIGWWTFAAPGVAAPTTEIHVVEHPDSDTVVHTGGDATDSTGDLLTFHNKVYDETDDHRVGRDMGECVRIDVRRGSWECRWTTFLEGGQISVEGPFYDTEDTVLAVTGGTGAYASAQGSMEIHALGDGKYGFIFELT